MKKCRACGFDNFDIATHCEKCKAPLSPFYVTETSAEEKSECACGDKSNNDLVIATKVLLFLQLATAALPTILLFCAFRYCIVMHITLFASVFLFCAIVSSISTIASYILVRYYFKKIAMHRRVSIAYKLAMLLWFNPLAGILMLCDSN